MGGGLFSVSYLKQGPDRVTISPYCQVDSLGLTDGIARKWTMVDIPFVQTTPRKTPLPLHSSLPEMFPIPFFLFLAGRVVNAQTSQKLYSNNEYHLNAALMFDQIEKLVCY